MSELDIKVESALSVIDDAVKEYKPRKVYALFSGGHDSLTITSVAHKYPQIDGVIHINTGIGIPETNQFVRDTCKEQGWPLHELRSAWDYLQLIIKHGFPGPASHGYMYRYLKERPLMRFIGQQKEKHKDTIALVGGMRSQESVRRMGHVEPMHKEGAAIWVSPIHDWSALETTEYIAANKLKRNLVKDTMHISGECLCGAFATKLERRELRYWYPKVDEKLTAYERVVTMAVELGIADIPRRHCQWGWHDGMPNEQMELFPMCHFCHAGREEMELTA